MSFVLLQQVKQVGQEYFHFFKHLYQYFDLFQLSLDTDNFFNTTKKYLDSYIKDAKKINPDFQNFTELYGIVMGYKESMQNQLTSNESTNLIQIDINLTIEGKYISESLLYNTDNLSYIKARNFTEHFVGDLLRQYNLKGLNKQTIEQLQQQVRIQIRSQCLYRTLLRKHAPILLNFSMIQIPSQVKEYLIPIEIKLKNQNGEIQYEDYFQWDILNESNNIQQFCQQLIEDAGLDHKYFSQLCYQIRTQINSQLEWKFMLLVKTYKSIHKDRQQPKINTQTTMMIRKNLPYTMDVLMVPENRAYQTPQNLTFSNTDVFSLLTKNFDILPQQFQNFLEQKQQKQNLTSSKQTSKITQQNNATASIQKAVTEQPLVSSSNKISYHNQPNNKNIKSCSTILPVINSQMYDKKGIKVQNNPYLFGVNNKECQNIWKKIIQERTTIAE